EEGIENRIARHTTHGEALVTGLEAMGVELFGARENKMPVVHMVKVPKGIDETAVRATMIHEFGVEIAGAFGPLAGKVWRIGTMGYSCRKNNIFHVLT